jgi:GntR family transcriptional regulator, transcriptional repressor for pyruvate dehydrogenase complex
MGSLMEIERIYHETVVEQVMEKMKELIASGRFKVHDKLPTEQEFAVLFGVGRNSVREAMKVFHYLGILESQTGKGTYVCERGNISTEALTWSILLGENDIFELIKLREVLELSGLHTLLVEIANRSKAADETVAALEQAIAAIMAAVEGQDLEALIQADYLFHGAIIAASGNSLFTAIYTTLRAFMHEEIKRTYRNVNIQKGIREHRELLDTICGTDERKAVELLRKHIDSVREKLKETVVDKGT